MKNFSESDRASHCLTSWDRSTSSAVSPEKRY